MQIIPDRDKWREWYLNDDINHVLHNGHILKIRKGYRFNAHSVPPVARWFLRRYNQQDIIAALVHDYLIDTMPWHRYDRKFVDIEYRTLMEKHSYGLRKLIMHRVVTAMGYLKTFGWRDYRGDYEKYQTKVEVKVTLG
jgi:hypothetical protein